VITSAAWFVVTGGVGAVLVPWWQTGWQFRHPLPYWSVAEAVGILSQPQGHYGLWSATRPRTRVICR
jgi:hypothetical protein